MRASTPFRRFLMLDALMPSRYLVTVFCLPSARLMLRLVERAVFSP